MKPKLTTEEKLMVAINGIPPFKFQPFQYVKITHLELNASGRIVRLIWDGSFKMYDVDYCVDGSLMRREFYEDEIEAK